MTRPPSSTRPRSTRPRSTCTAVIAVTAVALLVLTACAGAPKAHRTEPVVTAPRATPTPTASADGGLARIVIDADGIEALDGGGHSISAVPFSTDPQTAAEEISEALGSEGTAGTVTTDECYPELDESSWGGLHIYSSSDGLTRPGDAHFYVTADAATATGGVPITMPSGRGVGATRSQALSADPSAPSFSNDGEIDLHYDIGSGSADGDPATYFGALAVITDGKVTRLDSPVYYSRPC